MMQPLAIACMHRCRAEESHMKTLLFPNRQRSSVLILACLLVLLAASLVGANGRTTRNWQRRSISR